VIPAPLHAPFRRLASTMSATNLSLEMHGPTVSGEGVVSDVVSASG